MTAPNAIAENGVIGNEMKAMIASARREIDRRQDVALRQRFCSQPTLSEPMMLNRPIAAIIQPPV